MKPKSEFKKRWYEQFKNHLPVRAAALSLGLAAVSALGQSVIWLDNYSSIGGPIVTYGANVPANGVSGALGSGGLNSSWTAGLYYAVGNLSITDPAGTGIPNSALTLGTGAGSTAQFASANVGGEVGNFSTAQGFIIGAPAGSTITVELVVYPTYAGSYAAALYRIHSAPFTMTTVSLASPTPSTVGDAMLAAGINGLSLDSFPPCPCPPPQAYTYTFNYDGTITITRYNGPGGAVTIPSTIDGLLVTSIGDLAFSGCVNLTNVTIPNSVTSIGDAAFAGCSSLTSVTIPNSVTNIGSNPFWWCTSLTTITVDALNSVYSSLSGVLFNKSQTTLIVYPAGKTGSYTIPNSVTRIGDCAFIDCTNLTSLTMPNNVTAIGNAAFEYCTSLTSLMIPTNVTAIGNSVFFQCFSLTNLTIPDGVTKICDWTFGYCTSLTSFTIGNNVTNIGGDAFGYCTSLSNVTISNGLTSIGDDAFFSCTSLSSVTIPASVTSIGQEPFGSCTGLTAITVDPFNSVYSSVGGVLLNKSQTTLIVYPAGKTGSYTIPNSVTSIGNNGASIQGWAFARCTSLTSVTIPDSVTNIGDVAFYDCTSLTNVAIPNSVTTIRGGAFQSCAGLMSVTIGNSVASIGNSAFEYCGGLTRVCFQGNAPSLGGSFVFDGDNNATVYYLPGTTGWGPTFGGRPTALWTEVPTIQTPPQTQTAEAGSAVCLWAQATNALPLFYLWYFNGTNFLSCSTNCELDMTNVLFGQSGAYTMVFSNVLGAVTSLPAMLNVIPPVERRPVPGINLAGDSGSMLNLDYADSLSPAPNWSTLDSVALTGTSELYFDLTKPLPPLRFYRVWQTGTPAVAPSLTLPAMIPAITLTGNIGDKLRLDCINQYGPTDAWVTLDTITLTNTSQLYFDVSAPGQPQRLYRIVPVP